MNQNVIGRALVCAFITAFATSSECQPADSDSGTRSSILRPEDRGEDVSSIATSDVVSRLSSSGDRIERRKLAKVIGDRSIAGNLQLSDAEKQQIRQEVVKTLQLAKSPDANERSEARQQIERLWHPAAPALIASITASDVTISELAVKSLILMRNEWIISELVQEAKTTADEGKRQMLVFALSKMTEQRKSLIPGRACLDDKQSGELYSRLVAPALDSLRQAGPPASK